MIASIILGSVVLCGLIVASFYYFGLKPARLLEEWAAGLSNGGHFPEKPEVGTMFWLLPIHREFQAVADKIKVLKAREAEVIVEKQRSEFLHHCILATLIEGIIVVDQNRVITMANSEFINMFQLNQSPVQSTVNDVLPDPRLHGWLNEALAHGRVQSGRITLQTSLEAGRRPALEVSVVPIRTQRDGLQGVVVLFLPPPDRRRILETMKRHSVRLDNLVSELMVNSWGGSQKGLSLKKETVDFADLLEEAVSVFRLKTESSDLAVTWEIEPNPEPFQADPSYIQLALVQVLINVVAELEAVEKIHLGVKSDAEAVEVQIRFAGKELTPGSLTRVWEESLRASSQGSGTTLMGSTSGLGLVRRIIEIHSGTLRVPPETENQHLLISFPRTSVSARSDLHDTGRLPRNI